MRDSLIDAVLAKSRNVREVVNLLLPRQEDVAASQPPIRLRHHDSIPVVAPDRPFGESTPQGARTAPLRLAVIDGDSGFLHVLEKRVRARGWQQRVLPGAVPIEELVALRLGALVVDLAVLGAPGWAYLEQVCAALPALPVIVCTGPSTVAQRVRALRLGADDWLGKPCHPGGADRAHRGDRAPRACRRAAGRAARARSGRDVDPLGPVPGVRRRAQPRPHAPRVRADPAAGGQRRPGARARGDLPARVGLRDGARRPLGRRVRAQAAPEARARLAAVALHPHALRRRLPLRARARRRGRGADVAGSADAS